MTARETSCRVRAACLIAAALLMLTALLLPHQSQAGAQAEQEYAPPPRDALAADASGFDPDMPTLNTGAYAVSLNPDMRVDANGGCEIWLSNPCDNVCYLMLDVRLADSGLLIYRTGLVAPGEGIRTIEFVPDALAAMVEGEQDVQLTVRSFSLDDYVNLGDLTLNTRLTYSLR